MQQLPRTVILGHELSTYENRPNPAPHLKALIEKRLPNINIQLTKSVEESIEEIEAAEVVVTSGLPDKLLKRATTLRWVQTLSIGVDHLDLNMLRDRDIILTNSSGVKSEPIAEQVIAQLIIFERLLPAFEQQRYKEWIQYEGDEIKGKKIGIIGIGSVGKKIAEIAKSFDMVVTGTKRNLESVPDVVDEVFRPDDLNEVLGRSDYIVLACPLTAETQGLIGKAELDMMSDTSIIINISRGPVINQESLITSLQQDSIRGAALDVFEEEPLAVNSPLWEMPNVLVTPHIAGATPKKWERSADLFAKNYRRLVNGDADSFINQIL